VFGSFRDAVVDVVDLGAMNFLSRCVLNLVGVGMRVLNLLSDFGAPVYAVEVPKRIKDLPATPSLRVGLQRPRMF